MAAKGRLAPRGEDGFTLVELLVAISIFGVVLVALTGVLISSVRSVGDQRLRTAATRVATDHLETLRTLPFDLLAPTGPMITTTPDGRRFTIDTEVRTIDALTGAAAPDGRVKEITTVVGWTASGGASRRVSYTTAMADESGVPAPVQVIGTITMFPSPITTDGSGRALEDIEVTVPLEGFVVGTLVNLSWSNADGTQGAKTLTSTAGANWRGTVAKELVIAALRSDGRREVRFTVSAGSLTAVYDLSAQTAAVSPPVITSAAIDRNPVHVARAARSLSCDERNQCQNTTDVTFSVYVTGLDPLQDSVILQYQLRDSTSVEVPLAPVSGESGHWRLTARQKTTKFLTGPARAFRLTAIRSADGATTSASVARDVVSL